MSKSAHLLATRIRQIALLIAVTTICVAALGISHMVQSSFALTNGGSITAFGTPLTENFDSLISSGSATWTNNSTIPGWYHARTGTGLTIVADVGGSNAGNLYSYGSALSTDRALGSLGSGNGAAGSFYWGVRLANSTGSTITSLAVSYTGEQWRNSAAAAQTVAFSYLIGANLGNNLADFTTPGTPVPQLDFTGPVTGGTAGALDGNLPANKVAISFTITGLSLANGQEILLRWSDPDHSGSDHGLAIDDFSVTANGADAAPAVTSTMPANSATNVAVNSNVVINFSESVNATGSAFAIQCPTGSPQTFTQSSSPGSSFTLTPISDLPYNTVCTVTVIADQITDTDTNDPPDPMASDFIFSFTTADPPPLVATNVIINEVDADTAGADMAEFVELYDGGAGNTSLTGLAVVFYNGSNHLSYASFDLDGFFTNANGYFTLGNASVIGADLVFADNLLQNGADAVALYVGDASSFPTNTPVTTTNLQDAIVYGTDDPEDPGLLALLNPDQPQVNENGGGSGTTQSSQRCPNGTGGARNTSTYLQATPTPDGVNICPPPPTPSNSVIVVSQLYGGGGNSGSTYQNDYVELYNRGTATVDLGGWSLQYASATGNGWDFGKQPLGGMIGGGQYYLIALAGGANGAPLPPSNIAGEINMSGTSGKIALVDNFEGLVGNCPTNNPHVMDFVGYGSADCREGTMTAPSPGNTTAIFRLNGGSTDTDRNGSDFVTGSPNPRQTAPIVELGPLVLSTDPPTNGINAPRDATIEVTFTEPVDVIGPWFDITCPNSGQHNSATVAGSGKQHYITPNDNFIAGEQCAVTIFKDQIHDLDLDDAGPNTDTLPANYVWSFTVSMGSAPPYASSVHLTMGNPSGAITSIDQPNNYLMEKPEYALSYSRELGRPNWVSWHLSDEWVGTLTRVDSFRPDPAVPSDWYRVQSFDFTGSGFDRGHMTPNADRDKETSIPINQATFLMTNMVAQAPDNNQGPWAAFENYLRTLVPADEIYIVAGAVGTGGTGSNGGLTTTLASDHVTVPAYTWKVALVISKGINDISRVDCSARTIAVIMPNTQGIRNNPWENYLTNVDAVEALTGYNLFSNLSQAIQACIEAGTNGNNPPLDSLAPAVACASPDGAWHADNVTLACTASDSGSGLANPGDASFTLMTSVAAGAENANASTDSPAVCDVAGNCTTAVINGNKIDRKGPVITLTTPANGVVYQLNQILNAAYTCADIGSGPSECVGTIPNLSPVNTATFGSTTFVVNAKDGVGNTASMTVIYEVKRTLTAVDTAKVWIGLKNSDDVGLRLDLQTELLINGTTAATGDLTDIAAGSSGFNNAILQSVPLLLSAGPVDVPAGALMEVRVSTRRTCVGGGHNSGTAREWFNGQPVDSGASRDAGSRIRLTLAGTPSDYFLRTAFQLATIPGSARTSTDIAVNSSASCPARPYSLLGGWSLSLP